MDCLNNINTLLDLLSLLESLIKFIVLNRDFHGFNLTFYVKKVTGIITLKMIRLLFDHIYSEFIEQWVQICTPAKSKVKEEGTKLDFSEQCTNCEKVSECECHFVVFLD